METKITNIYKLDLELYTKFVHHCKMKLTRIITGTISIISVLNFIHIMYLNIRFDRTYIAIAIFNGLLALVSFLVMYGSSGFIAGYEFETLKLQGEENLDFHFIFEKDHFLLLKNNLNIEEKYINIKKIIIHNDFIVLKMKNKTKYILKCDSFNINNLDILLEKIEGGAANAD